MNVAAELSWLDRELEAPVQKIYIAVETMPLLVVGAVNQRIGAIENLDISVFFVQRIQVMVVFPQRGARSSDISPKLSRVRPVQVAHGRGQHHNIASREETFENKLP